MLLRPPPQDTKFLDPASLHVMRYPNPGRYSPTGRHDGSYPPIRALQLDLEAADQPLVTYHPITSHSPSPLTTPAAMAELDQHADEYHPKDALGNAIKATLVTGGAGAFISTIQNTLTKQNVGAWGVFTRSGGTIGVFGMP